MDIIYKIAEHEADPFNNDLAMQNAKGQKFELTAF